MKRIVFIISLLISAVSINAQNINDGLIAYYPFNGNAHDESTNSNDGSVINAILTADRFGEENKAYDFNGSNSYIDVGAPVSLNVSDMSQISICGWFSYRSNGFIIRYGTTGYGGGTGKEIQIYQGELHISNWNQNRGGFFQADHVVSNNEWHFFVFTFDYINNRIQYYLDGNIVGQYNHTLYRLPYPVLNIGRNTNGTSYFNGKIDDIRFYNRVITKDEMDILYGKTYTISPVILTLDVTHITNSTAETGGAVMSEGSSPVTSKGVCWSKVPNPTINDDFTVNGKGKGLFWSSLVGLEKNTKYYVRAYAETDDGFTYGDEKFFETNEIVLPDLYITNPYTVPENPVLDDDFSVGFSFENQGFRCEEASTLKAFLSYDQNVDIGDYLLFERLMLDPDYLQSVEIYGLTFPENTPNGTWYIILVADYNNDVEEIDETNNTNIIEINLGNRSSSINYDKLNELTFYPNPVTDIINFSDNVNSVNIFDMLGSNKKSFNSIYSNSIDVSDLESGVYIIKMNYNNKNVIKQFIKN
jgi:hypothetical protein